MDRRIEIARQVLAVEAAAIQSLRERIGPEFVKAVEALTECKGKVIWTGIGKSGYIARKLASTMTSTGTPAVYLHPAESSHGDLGLLRPDDVLVVCSYAGLSEEFVPLLKASGRLNLPVIALTGNLESPLAQQARVVLNVKIDREACPLGLAPTTSSTAMLAMGDALSMALLEAKGFSAEEFALNHPGGSLGRQLLRVREVMHSGASLPLLAPETSVREVLGLMSRGEVRGCAGVVDSTGRLMGVITDGDLRRWLDRSASPLEGKASDLMSSNPRTVDANELAERALFLMEQFRIGVLFVLDRSTKTPEAPVGLIHIQDLLKSRVK